MWYRADETLAKHPKTLRLSRLLKIRRREAVGLLHDLFAWGLYAADRTGKLRGLEPEDIGLALEYTGKAALNVVGALVDVGYLEYRENAYFIHDWEDYSGLAAEYRERDKIRKRAERERNRDGIPSEI